MDLLHKITRCPNIRHCFISKDSNACREIISAQHSHILDQHQVPEPWSGDIAYAPILFLSSNPSIDEMLSIEEREEFPLWSWPDAYIEDFFMHRYKGGRKQWIENGTHYLLRNGSRRKSNFWSDIRDLAEELLENKDVNDGVDYAITEVVHCKSKGEFGVKKALRECTKRYLKPVVDFSGAKVIVVLGSKAEIAMRREFDIPNGSIVGPQPVGGRQRYIVFLYHPSYCHRPVRYYYKPCTFGDLEEKKLQDLRNFLRRE